MRLSGEVVMEEGVVVVVVVMVMASCVIGPALSALLAS